MGVEMVVTQVPSADFLQPLFMEPLWDAVGGHQMSDISDKVKNAAEMARSLISEPLAVWSSPGHKKLLKFENDTKLSIFGRKKLDF